MRNTFAARSTLSRSATSLRHSNPQNPLMAAELRIERLLLGTICFYDDQVGEQLASRNLRLVITTGLQPCHFLSPEMSRVFRTMEGMLEQNRLINAASIAHEFSGQWSFSLNVYDFIVACSCQAIDLEDNDEALLSLSRQIINRSHLRTLAIVGKSLASQASSKDAQPENLAHLFACLLQEYARDFNSPPDMAKLGFGQVQEAAYS